MPLKLTNNAFGTLAAGINSSATSITLTTGQGARFPTLGAGDYFYATLIDTSNNLEIVKCTARSTDVLTVVRAQETTTARAYVTGDRIEIRITAQTFLDATDITALLATKQDLSSALTTYASTGVGMRNRIINGAMIFDQRNNGAQITGAASVYTVDRFLIQGSQTGKFNVQQVTDAPSGFFKSLKITVGTPVTVGASDYFIIRQPIEGNNVADLRWGAAGAHTVTLSFWVKSSLTGTFSGHLTNSGSARWYPFTYTISAANTWEYETITITGDTTGTWFTDNGVGIYVGWSLGTGSSNEATANAWTASTGIASTGSVDLVATSGATLFITGVQLEKGSTATPFDYRSYGTELQLCQRYFFTCGLFNFGTNAYYQGYFGGSNAVWNIRYPVQMRATPVATISQPTQVQYYSQGGAWTNTTIVLQAYNSGGPNWNTGTTDVTVGIASDSSGGGKLLYLTGGATTTLPTIVLSAEL